MSTPAKLIALASFCAFLLLVFVLNDDPDLRALLSFNFGAGATIFYQTIGAKDG